MFLYFQFVEYFLVLDSFPSNPRGTANSENNGVAWIKTSRFNMTAGKENTSTTDRMGMIGKTCYIFKKSD